VLPGAHPDAEGVYVPASPPFLDDLGFPLDPFPALELGVDADGVFVHHAGAVGASLGVEHVGVLRGHRQGSPGSGRDLLEGFEALEVAGGEVGDDESLSVLGGGEAVL